ncbi:MAG: VanZ family protein [Bacteroidales bacterium]|nr:VanZ family protein [Bacteroidales bacterium]
MNKTKTTLIDLILYSLLLIATPFIMLQNYLQLSIAYFSRTSFSIGSISIPYILIIALAIILFVFFKFRKLLNKKKVFALIFIVFLILIGHSVSDFYLNMKFYDLQQNWHYLAYSIFSFLMCRYCKTKKFLPNKIILKTLIIAVSLSTFDEIFQLFLSSRTFDISDISKDLWGAVIGIVFVFFIVENGSVLKTNTKIHHKKLNDYLKNPFSAIFYSLILSFVFLLISSVLSELKYLFIALIITLSLFGIIFLIIHYFQYKAFKRFFTIFFIIAIIAQIAFFIKYKNKNIVYNANGITVYKGLFIPYFDVLIKPSGCFRLVDKKQIFNKTDISTVFDYSPDIILIGRGIHGRGGEGLPAPYEVQFLFNPKSKKMVQVINLKNKQACAEYNKLKNEGKNVVFIIHNTD